MYLSEEVTPLPLKNIIILVNGHTRSAAELLAVSLKENNKGILVGETTFGKGTAQEIFRFSDGSGVRITTVEMFSPLKNTINHVGVDPDFLYRGEDIIKYASDLFDSFSL